jgi:hypothetical protein
LRLHSGLAGTQKFLDAQMLLEQAGFVGPKLQRLVRDWVMKTHTTNMFGIDAQAFDSAKLNGLIADQAPTFIHGSALGRLE